MERDLGGPGAIEDHVARGEEGELRQWLGQKVWPLGRQLNGEQLVQRVSGRPLSAGPFLRYLEQKLERLSG